MSTKTEKLKSIGPKTEIPIEKTAKSAKPKIPMPPSKNNTPVMYLFVLSKLIRKCTKIYNAYRTKVRDSLKPSSCDIFTAIVFGVKSLLLWSVESHDVDTVVFCFFYICDLNLEVIAKFQSNNFEFG